MSYLLSAHNISKVYANHKALDDVSISVPTGSIFGLLGPNGAGKTSLIRIINQITAPDEGRLEFDGKRMEANHAGDIGYLPEERGLYPKMKVGEQALYLAQLKGMDKHLAQQKLKMWFEKFEMEAWWNKKVHELSKGMQQKVQFIITVLHEPKLLILDEPFSGFDPINTNMVKQEILNLKKEGTTIIFSTHQMSSVEEICDSIALINNSKKILDGTVKDIRAQYRPDIYEVTFKGHMMGFANALWAGYQLIDHEKDGEYNKARVKLLGSNTPNSLIKTIVDRVEVKGLQEIIPSMNEIFIKKVTEMNDASEEVKKEEAS